MRKGQTQTEVKGLKRKGADARRFDHQAKERGHRSESSRTLVDSLMILSALQQGTQHTC